MRRGPGIAAQNVTGIRFLRLLAVTSWSIPKITKPARLGRFFVSFFLPPPPPLFLFFFLLKSNLFNTASKSNGSNRKCHRRDASPHHLIYTGYWGYTRISHDATREICSRHWIGCSSTLMKIEKHMWPISVSPIGNFSSFCRLAIGFIVLLICGLLLFACQSLASRAAARRRMAALAGAREWWAWCRRMGWSCLRGVWSGGIPHKTSWTFAEYSVGIVDGGLTTCRSSWARTSSYRSASRTLYIIIETFDNISCRCFL